MPPPVHMGCHGAVHAVSRFKQRFHTGRVEAPAPGPMAHHLHPEDVLEGVGHDLIFCAQKGDRILVEIGLVGEVVRRQRAEGRRVPGMEVHADLGAVARQGVPGELHEGRRSQPSPS